MADTTRDAAHSRLESLADEFLVRPGVDWGRMFGATGLRVRGKVFAVAVHDGGLMVKIPESAVAARVAAGEAHPVVMRGRELREWVVSAAGAPDAVWRSLLEEAHAYLEEFTPR
jgi:hypothetical protein